MKAFLNFKSALLLLLVVGLFTSFGCGVEKAEIDELVDVQESFPAATSRAENVTISGTITDPENVDPFTGEQLPLANAVVIIGTDTVLTDEDGNFSITLEDAGAGAVVRVDLDGHVDLVFPVSFADYEDNSSVDWSINLPESQLTTDFEPGTAVLDTFFYLGVPYVVEIPADAADQPIEIAIGPAGTVVGAGISGAFAVTGVHIETPEENFEFDNEIAISYNPVDAAQSGGIGSANPAALEPDAPEGAAAAAEEVEDAIAAAEAVIDAGGDPEDAAAAFVEEIYDGADEVSVDEDGNVVVVDTVEGSVLPGTGVVTEEDTLEQIDENGEPVEGENGEEGGVDLIDEETGEVPSVPHQGTADGGG